MEKPQVIRTDPKNIDAEVAGPVIQSLIEKGWTVETSVILEDPRQPEHDRLRLGLVMFPPRPEVQVTMSVGSDNWVRVGVVSAAIIAGLSASVFLLLLTGAAGG